MDRPRHHQHPAAARVQASEFPYGVIAKKIDPDSEMPLGKNILGKLITDIRAGDALQFSNQESPTHAVERIVTDQKDRYLLIFLHGSVYRLEPLTEREAHFAHEVTIRAIDTRKLLVEIVVTLPGNQSESRS